MVWALHGQDAHYLCDSRRLLQFNSPATVLLLELFRREGMVLTNFTGSGVGFGFGIGCGFGVGWGFGGMPLNFLGLGAGGGCGIGVGLGWGFGSAFGSQYRSSRITFQGVEFDSNEKGISSNDFSKGSSQVRSS